VDLAALAAGLPILADVLGVCAARDLEAWCRARRSAGARTAGALSSTPSRGNRPPVSAPWA